MSDFTILPSKSPLDNSKNFRPLETKKEYELSKISDKSRQRQTTKLLRSSSQNKKRSIFVFLWRVEANSAAGPTTLSRETNPGKHKTIRDERILDSMARMARHQPWVDSLECSVIKVVNELIRCPGISAIIFENDRHDSAFVTVTRRLSTRYVSMHTILENASKIATNL